MLERPEYQGHTVNFKTYKQSYKSKKTCYNPEEKWLVFENTHEAIIDADTWERVQELRKNKRRPTRTGKTNMFSGIVRCADCGEKLYYCTSKNFEAQARPFCLLYFKAQRERGLLYAFYPRRCTGTGRACSHEIDDCLCR
ncbi:MAG: recombinase family protein [Enterocloster sp.]